MPGKFLSRPLVPTTITARRRRGPRPSFLCNGLGVAMLTSLELAPCLLLLLRRSSQVKSRCGGPAMPLPRASGLRPVGTLRWSRFGHPWPRSRRGRVMRMAQVQWSGGPVLEVRCDPLLLFMKSHFVCPSPGFIFCFLFRRRCAS